MHNTDDEEKKNFYEILQGEFKLKVFKKAPTVSHIYFPELKDNPL
tara:strand:+ start:665 stop:799 length:135 start_codon:yes stop_codon:yes gene_type:complete